MLRKNSGVGFDGWLLTSFFTLALISAYAFYDVSLAYVGLFLYCIFWVLRASAFGFYGLATHYSAVGIYATLATSIQISEAFEFWGFGIIRDVNYSIALVLACLYCLGFEIGYHLSGAKMYNYSRVRIYRIELNFLRDVRFILSSFIVLIFSLLLIYSRPDLSLELRGNQSSDESRALSVFLFAYLPKLFLWGLCAVSGILCLATKAKRYVAMFLISLISAYLWAGPETTARQVILVGVLPLLYYFSTLTSAFFLPLIIWIGVLIVGPFLNYFSRDYIFGVETQGFPFSPDFDAMYIVAALVERIDYFDLGLGRYLLSAFSFFLPREFKLFSEYDPLNMTGGAVFSQSNVSTPPFLTSYLDFWYVGPLAFGLLIGLILGRSEIFRLKCYESKRLTFLLPFVLFSSYVSFIRGPILGWGPYIIAGILSYGVLIFLFNYFDAKRVGQS